MAGRHGVSVPTNWICGFMPSTYMRTSNQRARKSVICARKKWKNHRNRIIRAIKMAVSAVTHWMPIPYQCLNVMAWVIHFTHFLPFPQHFVANPFSIQQLSLACWCAPIDLIYYECCVMCASTAIPMWKSMALNRELHRQQKSQRQRERRNDLGINGKQRK